MKRNHNCYEFALRECLRKPTHTLVHGNPVGQGKIAGSRIGHAWVEFESQEIPGLIMVWDPIKDEVFPAPIYYHIGQITETVKYSSEEAAKCGIKYGHYGPWDESIQKYRHTHREEE